MAEGLVTEHPPAAVPQLPAGTDLASGNGHAPESPQPAAAVTTEASPSPGATETRPVVFGIGMSMFLLAVIFLGLAGYLYGMSDVQEARSQVLMYTQLQNELGAGDAPLSPTVAAGTPMVVLNIPRIGIHDLVVVQGTSSENLTLGPGHQADTPYPGEAGVSEIFGRRATFGAPFARIASLRPGNIITTVTGQGYAKYAVAAVAGVGQTVKDPAPNRLILLTASSGTVPTHYIEVDARLVGAAKPSPGVAAVVYNTNLPLAIDITALPEAALWALALVVLSVSATIGAARWSQWGAWLVAMPLALAVLLNLYQSLAALLPNVY